MPREFNVQVYGNNSSEDIINKMEAKNQAQNEIAQSAGGYRGGGETVTVPQFSSRGSEAGPTNSNSNIANLAQTQLRADVINDGMSNTGQPINGGYKKKRSRRSKRKRSKKYRYRNRKSRKY